MEKTDKGYEEWFIGMMDKRFAGLDEIARSVSAEQHNSMRLLELQLDGYLITAIEFSIDDRIEYISFIHRNSGKTLIIGLPLEEEEISTSIYNAYKDKADIAMISSNSLMFKRNTLENLFYWRDLSEIAGLPGELEQFKQKVIEATAPYDSLYLGESNGITITVVDALTMLNENKSPEMAAIVYAEYEDVHITGFEWTKSKGDTQEILAEFISELCNHVSRVVLHGVGLMIPGFECLKGMIKPHIESGKVHINPEGDS